MKKRKMPKDPNQLAAMVVALSTGDTELEKEIDAKVAGEEAEEKELNASVACRAKVEKDKPAIMAFIQTPKKKRKK